MPFLKRNCYPLYFLRRVLEDVMEQRRYQVGLEQLHGMTPLVRADFPPGKRDTAFLLGSAASINNMTERNWLEVSQAYSIGLNMWLLHDFVPDAYSVEIPGNNSGLYPELRDNYLRLTDLRKEDYADVLTFIRGTAVTQFFLANPVPAFLEGKTRAAFSLRLQGENREDGEKYTRAYGKLLRLNKALSRLPHLVPPGLSASILFLTCLCYLLGFRRVVLCGVELSSTGYFFDDPPAESRMLQEGWPIPQFKRKKVHGTFDRSRYSNNLNVKDKLLLLRESAFEHDGFEVYSGSATSALLPEIPLYDWKVD